MKHKNIARKKIAIVIPAANEEPTIKKFVTAMLKEIKRLRLRATIFFITDDVSKDHTRSILEKISKLNRQIVHIYEPRNKNVVDAYVRGYKEALRKKYDYIIEMDCGFSHLPKDLHKFIQGFSEGYDCVLGVRPLWSLSYKVPFKRRAFSLGGTILGNVLLGTHFSDMTSGYEGFTKNVAKKIFAKKLHATGHFFQTEVRFMASKYTYKEVPVTYNFPSPRVNSNSIRNSFTTLFYLTRKRLQRS